jgi:hypothetical protein
MANSSWATHRIKSIFCVGPAESVGLKAAHLRSHADMKCCAVHAMQSLRHHAIFAVVCALAGPRTYQLQVLYSTQPAWTNYSTLCKKA